MTKTLIYLFFCFSISMANLFYGLDKNPYQQILYNSLKGFYGGIVFECVFQTLLHNSDSLLKNNFVLSMNVLFEGLEQILLRGHLFPTIILEPLGSREESRSSSAWRNLLFSCVPFPLSVLSLLLTGCVTQIRIFTGSEHYYLIQRKSSNLLVIR